MTRSVTIRVVAHSLPGRVCGPVREVPVGLQVRREREGLVPGDASAGTREAEVMLIARGLTDKKGERMCASVRLSRVVWGVG